MMNSADTFASEHSGSVEASSARAPRRGFSLARLVTASRFVYLIGLLLLLVSMGSSSSTPSPLLKLAIFSSFLALSVILFSLGGGLREALRAPGRWWTLAVFLLPISYALSWWYSSDRSVALIGVGSEVDTVLFTLVATLTFFLGFALMRTERHAKMLLSTAALAIGIIGLFQYINVFSHVAGDPSINLVGKWNDFGILMSLGALMLIARLELSRTRGWRKPAAIVALVLVGILLLVVQFNLVWWFVLIGALVIGGFRWMRHSSEAGPHPHMSNAPWYAGAAVVVSILAMLFMGWISSRLPGSFSITSLEVRPAFSSTLQIGSTAHQGFLRTILGSGPNTFQTEWMIDKPVSVNQTPFWSIDFATGFSVLATAFATVGLLGVLLWLLPLLLIILALLRAFKTHDPRFIGSPWFMSLGGGAILLWATLLFYAPSQDLVLLGFALIAALWGTVANFGAAPAPEGDSEFRAFARPSVVSRIGIALAAFVLVIATIWPAAMNARQFLSYWYEQRANNALNANDLANATALDQKSQSVYLFGKSSLTGDNLRLGIAIEFAQMQQLANASTTPATVAGMRQQFQATLQSAIAQGQAAAGLHPNDYQAYAELGEVYEFLVPLQVQGAYDHGQAAYKAAMTLAPKNPTLPLLLARLEATQDLKTNLADVQKLVGQSLTLKSNYTDALLFEEQLAVSENDLTTATQAAAAAVASSPQDPTLWFQLGLFYYTGADYADATQALKNAVTLESDYANAKYFLGLSEYKTGDTQDAIAQFSDLQKANPDNAEVKLVLGNMQAGAKDPFQGETPPQPPPQTRTTAPVTE